MDAASEQKLQELRKAVLNDLAGLAQNLGDGGPQDIEVLIMLARTSGNTQFLERALEAIHKLEDEATRTDLLLSLLGEVELQLGQVAQVGQSQNSSSEG